MRIPRIYQNIKLEIGSRFELDEAASIHLARVLRLRPGDGLIVFNGHGGECQARLVSVQKRRVMVEIESYIDANTESPFKITLIQCVSRGERMDFVVQKSVELGVMQLQPVLSERCNVSLSNERKQRRLTHWQSIAQSASEQCGRNKIMEIKPIVDLRHYLDEMVDEMAGISAHQIKLVMHTHATQSVSQLPEFVGVCEASVLIGPEGGFTDDELQQAEQSGFQLVSMGPRILRTETAALSMISALQTRYGDF